MTISKLKMSDIGFFDRQTTSNEKKEYVAFLEIRTERSLEAKDDDSLNEIIGQAKMLRSNLSRFANTFDEQVTCGEIIRKIDKHFGRESYSILSRFGGN